MFVEFGDSIQIQLRVEFDWMCSAQKADISSDVNQVNLSQGLLNFSSISH